MDHRSTSWFSFALRRLPRKAAHILLLGLLLAGLGTACSLDGPLNRAPAAEPAEADWVQVYFSQPENPNSASLRGGPDAALAEAIDAARYSVEAALYNLDLWSVRDALLRAQRRGVMVQVVAESDHLLGPEFEELVAAGITVRGDRREPLMHHKFVILDRVEVWTGSMNLTINGAYRNDNNLIRIRSTRVAENYGREFEEMFVEDRFGALSRADTPHPWTTLAGSQVGVFFSPDDGVAEQLLAVLQQARESIFFMSYAFTADPLAEMLLEKTAAGITVRGVIERGQADNMGSDYQRLRAGGVEVVLDGNPRSMHHKVIIVDRRIVITGSYNFSRSAEEFNDENLLIIDNAELAQEFLIEFERVYTLASK